MKKIGLTGILWFFFSIGIGLNAQSENALRFAEMIDTIRLFETLDILASDSFEGRKAGKQGETAAADYIADRLQKYGIKKAPRNSYFQPISYYEQSYVKKHFYAGDVDFSDHYYYYNSYGQANIIESNEVIFIGYGAISDHYDDLSGLDIKDKVVMMLSGNPCDKNGDPYTRTSKVNWIDAVKELSPKAVLVIREGFMPFTDLSSYSPYSFYVEAGEKKIPDIRINEELANILLSPVNKTVKQIIYETERYGKPQSASIQYPLKIYGERAFRSTGSSNVIGYIEGSEFKNEYIVVTAHYDHEGKDNNVIYNGADDNASGVSSVLEMARIFALAKKAGKGPKRSIVFLFPTAEEAGLFGSYHYVNNPVFSLNKTVACVNIDMLGRIDKIYENRTDDYVYVSSHSEMSGTLPIRLEEINKGSYKLTTDYKYSTPGDPERYFERSDQYNFATKNIPSVFFTSGDHEDYHRSTDDTDKINFKALQKRTQLVFLFIWSLADSSDHFTK